MKLHVSPVLKRSISGVIGGRERVDKMRAWVVNCGSWSVLGDLPWSLEAKGYPVANGVPYIIVALDE